MSVDYHILVIEDDSDIRELVTLQLELENYKVSAVSTWLEAKKIIAQKSFDLFIIDWMLPDSNGPRICKELRENLETRERPILLLTALSTPEDIVKGLDAGADDYITKPFDIEVLHARVRSQLRRAQLNKTAVKTKKEAKIIFDDLVIDVPKCSVTLSGNKLALTHTEFQILILLAEKPGIVFSRELLIEKILGEEVYVTNRTIDTHIAGLRKKLLSRSTIIETIRGVGYKIQDPKS